MRFSVPPLYPPGCLTAYRRNLNDYWPGPELCCIDGAVQSLHRARMSAVQWQKQASTALGIGAIRTSGDVTTRVAQQ